MIMFHTANDTKFLLKENYFLLILIIIDTIKQTKIKLNN